MAVRAVANITSVDNFDYADGTFAVTVDFAIIGTDYGDFGTGQGLSHSFEGLDPEQTPASIRASVEASMKSFLIASNVPFGPSQDDTVVLL